jgi:hypothetical protein
VHCALGGDLVFRGEIAGRRGGRLGHRVGRIESVVAGCPLRAQRPPVPPDREEPHADSEPSRIVAAADSDDRHAIVAETADA